VALLQLRSAAVGLAAEVTAAVELKVARHRDDLGIADCEEAV
jgi:hypothetical protein